MKSIKYFKFGWIIHKERQTFPRAGEITIKLSPSICMLMQSYVQGCRKWIYALKIISEKLSSIGQFGLRYTRNLSYCPIFGQLVMKTFRKCSVQHANNRTIVEQCLSNCLIFGQCCVQQSNGCFIMHPTVHWLVSWVFSSPMVGLCFFQLSNCRTMLCPTF